MDNIKSNELVFKNLSMVKVSDNWNCNNSSLVGGVLEVNPKGTCYIDVIDTQFLKGSKYLKSHIVYSGVVKDSDRYKASLMVKIDCYNDKGDKVNIGSTNSITIIANSSDDIDSNDSTYTNERINRYNASSMVKCRVTIKNIGKDKISIHELGLYNSVDVDINQIIQVVEDTTISADVMMGLTSWVQNLQVDRLETNVMSISNLKPFLQKRNFIKAEDWSIQFNESNMLENEFEQLYIEVADGQQLPIYWTAIGENPQAYRFVTTTRPDEIYDGITQEQSDAFRFMVHRSDKTATKLSIEFHEYTDNQGNKTGVPRIVFGEGTTPDDTTDENGKGILEKGFDGFKMEYVKTNGDRIGVYLDDSGGRLVGIEGAGGSGALPLKDIKFYNNGFDALYGNNKETYRYNRDDAGKLVGLTMSNGDVIQISYDNKSI